METKKNFPANWENNWKKIEQKLQKKINLIAHFVLKFLFSNYSTWGADFSKDSTVSSLKAKLHGKLEYFCIPLKKRIPIQANHIIYYHQVT